MDWKRNVVETDQTDLSRYVGREGKGRRMEGEAMGGDERRKGL